MRRKSMPIAAAALGFLACSGQAAFAQDEAELAKQLSNPLAALISLPIQANYDDNVGSNDEVTIWRTNIQPVVPIDLNSKWNLISRTILPIIYREYDFAGVQDSTSGAGDVVQSFFFSPKAPTSSGLIWGVGPVVLIPTGSTKFGSSKWGIGPTAVALKQQGPWTYGALVNHIESFADDNLFDNEPQPPGPDISATFVQPFISYIYPSKTTVGFNTESTYDWEAEKWSVPLNLTIAQLLKFGDQLVQVGGGIRYWAESTDAGPEGWGLRLQLTFLFPK